VGIVPHTHWDREWHVPFQAGRVRLVRLVDAVLDELECGSLGHFWLDGQTAAVDDYLEVRPEAEQRVRAVVADGRLGIGPWVVPMDEFVVSPETIVRNLATGLRRRAELGAAGPAVGYGPDIFGHVAQLPQLLRLAGIDQAVVWRGVPQTVCDAATAFRWEAPDGSAVRTEHLFGSYANGRSLPADGPGLVERARSWEEEVGGRRVAGLLLMNGGDQRMPEAWVAGAVAEANAGAEYRFELVDLARWFADERTDMPDAELPVWRGELRSAAGAPLLAGVISNRVDVRAAAAAAERAVERRAEPLLALFRPAGEWAAASGLLAVAWDRLIANSAHDSACACCTDAVADQVLVRYAEARQIGEALADQALADLATETGTGPAELLVVNTRPGSRSGVVEISVPAGRDPSEVFIGADGIQRAVQLLDVTRSELFAARVAGVKVGWVADRITDSTFDGQPIRAWSVESGPGRVLHFEAAGPDEGAVDLKEARDVLLTFGQDGLPIDVRMQSPPLRRILVETGPVAGYGWTTIVPTGSLSRSTAHMAAERDSENEQEATIDPSGISVRVEDGDRPTLRPAIDNGIVRVEIDTDDGTITIRTRNGLTARGLNRYVNGGDGGDTYTWCPPADDTIVERPESVMVDVEEAGPLRGRVVVTTTYRWPTHAEGDEDACTERSAATTTATIRTAVSLTAGDPVVAVETTLENRCRDHRLRVHFPLPAPVDGSHAGCAFAVVRRGLETEGGLAETPPPTFPARRFVDCSGDGVGLAVITDGVVEYEVIDRGRELAVTLLRATGFLSRRRLALRPDPAGPAVPVEGAQVQGTRRWRYGLVLHSGDWEAAHLSRRADSFLNPLEVAVGSTVPTNSTRPSDGQILRVDGAEVSAVVRDAGDVMVRLFHPGSGPASAAVGDQTVDLRPAEIVAVRVPGAG
jgi:mannosylglycerate hydrolase